MIRKTLKKIQTALTEESHQTKQMISTYLQYTQGEASEQEMDAANQQFQNFLKTIGLGIFAVLPFSPVTIPAIIKLGERYGIEMLPESFRKQFRKEE